MGHSAYNEQSGIALLMQLLLHPLQLQLHPLHIASSHYKEYGLLLMLIFLICYDADTSADKQGAANDGLMNNSRLTMLVLPAFITLFSMFQ